MDYEVMYMKLLSKLIWLFVLFNVIFIGGCILKNDQNNNSDIKIIEDSSYTLTPIKISDKEALEIINLVDTKAMSGVYIELFLNDIQKISNFDTVKKIYSDEYNDYYYVKFSTESHDFYVSFFRNLGEDDRLIPNIAFYSDKIYSQIDFSNIICGVSTIEDVEAVDSLTLHKNTSAVYPTDGTYDKTTFHITDEGIMFFCYSIENNKYVVKNKYIEDYYPELVSIMNDNKQTK